MKRSRNRKTQLKNTRRQTLRLFLNNHQDYESALNNLDIICIMTIISGGLQKYIRPPAPTYEFNNLVKEFRETLKSKTYRELLLELNNYITMALMKLDDHQ